LVAGGNPLQVDLVLLKKQTGITAVNTIFQQPASGIGDVEGPPFPGQETPPDTGKMCLGPFIYYIDRGEK
jgi:hypothetical protein